MPNNENFLAEGNVEKPTKQTELLETAVKTSSGDPTGEEFPITSETFINLDLPEPVGMKRKRVAFNLSTIEEGTAEDSRRYHRREAASGILKRRSRIPRYNDTTVRSKDPQKANFLYKNAGVNFPSSTHLKLLNIVY